MRKILLFAATMLFFGACTDNTAEQNSLSINPDTREISFDWEGDGEVTQFTITANTQWTFEVAPRGSWLTAVQSDTAPNVLFLIVSPNQTYVAPDPVKITIMAGNAEPIEVTCTQEAMPEPDPFLNVGLPEDHVMNFFNDGSGDQNSRVVVTTNREWEFSLNPANGWLSAEKEGNALVFTAPALAPGAPAPGPVTVTIPAILEDFDTIEVDPVVFTAEQEAGAPPPPRPRYFSFSWGGVGLQGLSENGRYVCGYTDGGYGYVFDTWDFNEDGTVPEGYQPTNLYTVDDERLYADGTFLVQGIGNDGVGHPLPVTADGSLMVNYRGTIAKNGAYNPADPNSGIRPYLMYTRTGGIAEDLPLPARFDGRTYYGADASYINPAGTLISGRVVRNNNRTSCYWKKNEAGEWEWFQTAPELLVGAAGPFSQPAEGASHNGRYTWGAVYDNLARFMISETHRSPFFEDIETGEVTVIDVYGRGRWVSDEGEFFYNDMVHIDGEDITFAEWVEENYDGLEVPTTNMMLQGMTADKKTIMWMIGAKDSFINYFIFVR